MSWKSFAADYLSFSKKDRIALFLILLVAAGCYLLPFFLKSSEAVHVMEDSLLSRATDSLIDRSFASGPPLEEPAAFPEYRKKPAFTPGHRFPFDPNTLPPEAWARLGLPPKTIKTISNYRNKGGRFYKKEDLQKIWGLPPGFYEWVEPYIRITPVEDRSVNQTRETEKLPRSRVVKAININVADTTAWIALPGIGSRLAQRILQFRDKLGGFYSVEQVGETYGLPDSTFQKLRPLLHVNADEIKRFNINTATKEELKTHPYIRWNLANAIVEYRNQHGPFKDLSQLKNIVLVDEMQFSKISHYLVIE